MKSLANLSNSAFSEIQGIPLGLSEETRPRKFLSTDSGLPLGFWGWDFSQIKQPKNPEKEIPLWLVTVLSSEELEEKIPPKNSLPFFKTHWVSYLNGV